ncbi:MAG: hypothetical protein ACLU7D_08275 [Collinsella sp.]
MNALPSQSRFIIGTEACERFSFYGMKSILMLYMTGHLLMSENWATSTLHIFVGMVYPAAGGGGVAGGQGMGTVQDHPVHFPALLRGARGAGHRRPVPNH